jgi:hypothetical protein
VATNLNPDIVYLRKTLSSITAIINHDTSVLILNAPQMIYCPMRGCCCCCSSLFSPRRIGKLLLIIDPKYQHEYARLLLLPTAMDREREKNSSFIDLIVALKSKDGKGYGKQKDPRASLLNAAMCGSSDDIRS